METKLDQLTGISKGFKAYLYDCDGTLADNMGAHKETYIRVAADKGSYDNRRHHRRARSRI